MRYLITLFYLLATLPASATLNEVDKTQIFSKNMLVNGGFESGKAKWTPNDTADFAVTGTSPMIGLYHATWDADADTDTLTTTAVTIPAGYYGRNMVASCLFTVASGTATNEIQAYDGSNVLNEASITSSTTPTRTSVNFIAPSSGSLSLRIYANADEPSVAIDDCYLGPAEGYNVSSVSQATLHGTASYAGTASCQWSGTSASYAAFSADADCPTPTVTVNAAAPATKVPGILFTNLPPGRYVVDAVAGLEGGTTTECSFALSDGTTTSGATYAVGNTLNDSPLQGEFTYTTSQSDITFQIYQDRLSGANSCLVTNTTEYVLKFRVTRYPLSSEQTYTPDLQAMSWSGYHDSTCVWSRTNTAFGDFTADATCNLVERTSNNFGSVTASGSVLPAITFTPKKTGRYYVCAIANSIAGGTTSNTWALQLIDGASTVVAQATGYTPANGAYQASMCGVYVVTSISAKTLTIQSKVSSSSIAITGGAVGSSVEWSIFSLDQSIPAPVLTNMVTTPESGGVRITSAIISSAGAVSSEEGDWINGSCAVTDTSLYTCTLNSGIFSAKPKCQLTTNGADTNYTFNTLIDASISATQVVYRTANASTTKTAFGVVLTCRASR